MAETDPDHKVKLVVDEWGAWHRAGTEVDPAFLFGQTSTLRDALIAALTLDIFNRHADKVAMANVAQLINNLHSLFLARGGEFTATPNFHVFEMYAAHQSGRSLHTAFSVPAIGARAGRDATLPGLAGSASLKGKELILTVVNPHAREAREAEIVVRGATMKFGRIRVLRSDDIHARNTFDAPHALEPLESVLPAGGATIIHRFPAASVTRFQLQLS
jgi:alpha-N-arabinofuranosidase